MTRKSSKHLHATYGTLNSCFDLIGSVVHTVISTTGDRTKNHSLQKPKLPLGQWFMSHISDAELTSHI